MVNRIILFLFCTLLWACSEENEVTNNVEDENQIDWYAAADSSSTSLINSFWNVGSRYLIMIVMEILHFIIGLKLML